MTISSGEALEAIAVSRLLQRLGSDMNDVIRYHLRHRYGIRLDEGSKTPIELPRLHDILNELIGPGANILLQEIYHELDSLRSDR